MKQPPRFVHSIFLSHVCKLKKAIYGSKQAPCAWFHHFNSFLLSHGFLYSHANPSIFMSRIDSIILVLHVDEIAITSNFEAMLLRFITFLLSNLQ